MTETSQIMADPEILPYSAVVGQETVKLGLEIAFVCPRIGGVLLSGERGTGKSTTVRAFCRMMYDQLPVTIPINATEDRVVGGWRIDALMDGRGELQPGLLEEANSRLLYIDEINLLDDHIVNILLDVTSTGVLEVQREGLQRRIASRFALVGTMNPEEGGLRPQLLDRFGLNVTVRTEPDRRRDVLRHMLTFDRALGGERERSSFMHEMTERDQKTRTKLEQARSNLPEISDSALDLCIELVTRLDTDGHRGERTLALAAQALAAIEGAEAVRPTHIRAVAPLALQHRLKDSPGQGSWGATQQSLLDGMI